MIFGTTLAITRFGGAETTNAKNSELMKDRQFMRTGHAVQERDAWTSMFQPDVLASAQYMEKWRYRRSHEPEKMLMCAVLEDAISCYQRFFFASTGRGRAAFEEAENWLMCEKSDWPFSFERICEALDLNPDYIRAGLARWRSNAPVRQTKMRLFYVVRVGRRVRRRFDNRLNGSTGALAII